MTDLDLDAIRALCETATPGPWHVEIPPRGYPQRVGTDSAVLVAETFCGPESPCADADFIAAARTALPQLVAEIERLRDASKNTMERELREARYISRLERQVLELEKELERRAVRWDEDGASVLGDVGKCPQCGRQSRSYSKGCEDCGYGRPAVAR